MSDQLLETIDRLLDSARPGGIAQQRLVKYRDQRTRNVLLGPSVLKYIRDLADKADNVAVECRYLTGRGNCQKIKRICKHVDNNKECKKYEPNRPQTRGNPLERLNL